MERSMVLNKTEHERSVAAGLGKPRVFRDRGCYVAWTPTWEGPPRPTYDAAKADLNEATRKR